MRGFLPCSDCRSHDNTMRAGTEAGPRKFRFAGMPMRQTGSGDPAQAALLEDGIDSLHQQFLDSRLLVEADALELPERFRLKIDGGDALALPGLRHRIFAL